MNDETRQWLTGLLEQELEVASDLDQVSRLCCRLALLAWDLRGDRAAARRWLSRADPAHPLVVDILCQLLLDLGDAPAVASQLERTADDEEDPRRAQSLRIEAALIWLLWVQDPVRAREACLRSMAAPSPPSLIYELFELSLLAGEDQEALIEVSGHEQAPLSLLIHCGACLLDRLDLPGEAEALFRRAHAIDDEDPLILEMLLEVSACSSAPDDRLELMEQKLKMIGKHGESNREVLALAFDLSRLAGEAGQVERSAEHMSLVDPPVDELETTEPLVVKPLPWTGSLMRAAKRDLAARTRDSARLADIYLAMAEDSEIPAMARAYRTRAAQLMLLLDSGGGKAEALIRENLEVNPADPHASRALERLLLQQGRMDLLCAHYQAQADIRSSSRDQMLQRGAIIAEAHLGDGALAAAMWRDCQAAMSSSGGYGHLQRLYRVTGAEARLIEAYRREADTTSDDERAALCWTIVSAMLFEPAQPDAAAAAAREALRVRPGDTAALAVLTAIHREGRRSDELAAALRQLLEHLVSPVNQAACLVELSGVVEPEEAQPCLEQALELSPYDSAVLEQLVDICEQNGNFEDAVRWAMEMGQALASEPGRAAAAHAKAGRLYLYRMDDGDRAEVAFARARKLDPLSVEAARGLAEVFGVRGDLRGLLGCLREMIQLSEDDAVLAELHLEIAQTLEKLEVDLDEILNAYMIAVQHESVRHVAIRSLERICRDERRLDFFVAVLEKLPPDPETLELQEGAYDSLGDLEALAEVRARLVELSSSDVERADRLYELGRAWGALNRASNARSAFEQTLELVPMHRPALQALQKIYAAGSDVYGLTRLLERELEITQKAERRVEILVHLGGALTQIGQDERACTVLGEALELQPANLDAMWSLEQIYDPDQPIPLAQILDRRSEVVEASERVSLKLRAAKLLATNGRELDALPILDAAFAVDPGRRDVFTLYEALCYDFERWQDLMAVYDKALDHVEREGGRAYRPLDLFLRRGQLQLNHLAQPGEAVASFLSALEQDPKSESVMKSLETLFVQQQDWHGLIHAYERRASLVPNNELFRIESLRQGARLATGRLEPNSPDAIRLWEEIHAADPTDEEALENLERLYEASGQHEKLASLLEIRIALSSEDEDAINLRMRLAKIRERDLEDHKGAIEAYEGVLELHQHQEDALDSLARIYEAVGDWENCSNALKDLVLMEVDHDQRSLLYFKCGSIAESRFQQDDEAIGYYEAALNENSACLPAIHGLRDLFLRKEEWTRALETLDMEVQLWEEDREQASVLARMGEIHLNQLRDVPKAIELFEDAIAIDKDCQPAALSLFEIYSQRMDNDRALAVSERLIPRMNREGDPQTRSNFFCRRGQLLSAEGALVKGVESLVHALELEPENLEALDWLIALCRRRAEAYDFASVFRDLEQVYRREENQPAVAHVLVAAGTLNEIAGDAEGALARYQEAMEVAPRDFAPAKAVAALLVRLRQGPVAISVLDKFLGRARSTGVKIKVLIKLGEIQGDVLDDQISAAQSYQEVLQVRPSHREAAYRLAQIFFQLGHLDRAFKLMCDLLEQLGHDARPQDRSTYITYLGVITLEMGDREAALKHLWQAYQLDERNVEVTIALARQMVVDGDRESSRKFLKKAIRRTRKRGADKDVAALQRCLGQFFLGQNDLEQAAEQYKSVVAVGRRIEDRIALAELHSMRRGGVGLAISELCQVMAQESFNPHILKLLASLYEQQDELFRNFQVLQILELLGMAGMEDLRRLKELRREYVYRPVVTLREVTSSVLAGSGLDPFIQRVWEEIGTPLEHLFPLDQSVRAMEPALQVTPAGFRQLVEHCVEFVGVDAAVFVAADVPGGAAADNIDGGRVVVDRLLVDRSVSEVAFLFGRYLAYCRTGHQLLSRIAFDDRLLLSELLGGLLEPEEAHNDLVQEFRNGLSRRLRRRVDAIAQSYQEHLTEGGAADQSARWFDSIDRRADQIGLLACDDIAAALRMSIHLGGQDFSVGPKGEVAIQLVKDGPELVQFFLSDEYLDLRHDLTGV